MMIATAITPPTTPAMMPADDPLDDPAKKFTKITQRNETEEEEMF